MKRITEYDAITTIAEADVLPIVDVSDTEQASTGSTRKASVEKIGDYLKDRTETLTNKTLTNPKVNENVAVTATSSELNKLDGTDVITADLDKLHEITATASEINQLDDVEVGGTATGDIVTIDGTQTLTNKTLGSPLFEGTWNGWVSAGETWTYASADAPTFTFTVAADVTTKYSAGMRIKLTQTTVKYFIITAVSAYSGGNTTITVYGGTDYTLANTAISANYYSMVKAPQGFPLNPSKWSLTLNDATNRTQASPTQNTWYNLNSSNVDIPIGHWKVSMSAQLAATRDPAGYCGVRMALSTSTSSESDLKLHSSIDGNPVTQLGFTTVHSENYLELSSKTKYYAITRTTSSGVGTIYRQDMYITILSAYL